MKCTGCDYACFCVEPMRCPEATGKIIGKCGQCKDTINEWQESYIDSQGNHFCDLDCAIKYYGIKEY